MLTVLSIKNYALIKSLEMKPAVGLNIITGETGAGKSIMLGAIGLLLGNRADTKVLLDSQKKCSIEGEFDISNYQMQSDFETYDLDYDDLTIIRREINPNGKSRAFINDLPVTLEVLKSIGLRLLDIHSQHESIAIGKKSAQLEVIDSYCQNKLLRNNYTETFKRYKKLESKLQKLYTNSESKDKESDYNTFLLNELVGMNLTNGEQETLEEELRLLENAEDIKLKLSQVVDEVQDGELAINDRLAELARILTVVSDFSTDLEKSNERFISVHEELKDIVKELEAVNHNIEHSPEKLAEVNERLGLIYQLQQKHKVSSISELLGIQESLESEVLNHEHLEEEIVQAKKELELTEKELIDHAEKLSERRRAVLDEFSDKLNKLLQYVGIPEGHVELVYKRTEPNDTGIDEVQLLFSANKGIKPEPVKRVASGGEFSRLMFCIKYLLADKTAMPTIIFDEIDTGVSGEIAIKMAKMMKKMSENHQVMSISHLPQVAAKGDAHYFVYKNNESQTSESLIKRLEENDRVDAIAKMIGGDNPSDAAVQNAKELIAQ